ncbi:MAG: AbrB/MazE/SpoVT family DNA-binding domain-containing protein [Anaerolineae bacterium]|jgi:bifunctional DNA-binding transcriptional regulator/antitoxin component of YhaV-PrlF toxin-antitoxin module
MVEVQFSDHKEIILPESLGRALGLHEGDRVEVKRQDNVLCLRRWDTTSVPGPLTDLARIISSSRPSGSIDVDEYMNKHGYEQLDERPDPFA